MMRKINKQLLLDIDEGRWCRRFGSVEQNVSAFDDGFCPFMPEMQGLLMWGAQLLHTESRGVMTTHAANRSLATETPVTFQAQTPWRRPITPVGLAARMIHNVTEDERFNGTTLDDQTWINTTLWLAWWLYFAYMCKEAWPCLPTVSDLPKPLQHRKDLPTGQVLHKLWQAGRELPWGKEDYSPLFPPSLAPNGLFDIQSPGDDYINAYNTNVLTHGAYEQKALSKIIWRPVLPQNALHDYFPYSPINAAGPSSSTVPTPVSSGSHPNYLMRNVAMDETIGGSFAATIQPEVDDTLVNPPVDGVIQPPVKKGVRQTRRRKDRQ
jgi:hypothetical protein